MRWHRRESDEEPDVSEATRARMRAERDLEQRRAETSRVRMVLAEWARIQKSNHIAANFEASVRGGGRP